MSHLGHKVHISRREVLLVSGLARIQRLLRRALQRPEIQQLFDKLRKRRARYALKHAISIWKGYTQSHKEHHRNQVVIKDENGMTRIIQKVVRKYLKEKSQSEIIKPSTQDQAAIIIQKLYRGYVGRGEVILRERQKLLRFIRMWSKGASAHLFHIDGMFCLLSYLIVYICCK
jgi:hypothetical protein